MVGNDNWWRTHGIGCTSVAVTGSGAGSGAGGGEQGAEPEDTCLASYTLIETVHASLFMFLTVSKPLSFSNGMWLYTSLCLLL